MKLLNILLGIFYIVFECNPAETLLTYSLFLGFIHLFGAVSTIIYFFVKKLSPIPWGNILVSIAISLTMLFLQLISLTVILWIFIVSFLLMAIYYLMQIKKNKNIKYYYIHISLATLAIIYSVIMIISPITGFNTLAKLLAFGVIMNGVAYLFTKKKTRFYSRLLFIIFY